jgi:hypothetical protein
LGKLNLSGGTNLLTFSYLDFFDRLGRDPTQFGLPANLNLTTTCQAARATPDCTGFFSLMAPIRPRRCSARCSGHPAPVRLCRRRAGAVDLDDADPGLCLCRRHDAAPYQDKQCPTRDPEVTLIVAAADPEIGSSAASNPSYPQLLNCVFQNAKFWFTMPVGPQSGQRIKTAPAFIASMQGDCGVQHNQDETVSCCRCVGGDLPRVARVGAQFLFNFDGATVDVAGTLTTNDVPDLTGGLWLSTRIAGTSMASRSPHYWRQALLP